VADDKGNTGSGTTTVTVNAPPPPPAPAVPPAPQASNLCSISFERDAKRPVRVDNEAKACLDDVALALQRSSDSKVALVGNASGKEKRHKNFASERALNTKEYLVKEKGIDPSRIMVYTGTDDAQNVTTTLVPAGATNPVANDTAVPDRPERPVHHRAAKKK